jgi:AhpD family alkylhydroperoxidase
MKQRLNVQEKGQKALRALYGIGAYMKDSPVERQLRELVNFRVSQINACAYCLDMHYKDARANGETEQRLYGLSAWRESPYYTEREGLHWHGLKRLRNVTCRMRFTRKRKNIFLTRN